MKFYIPAKQYLLDIYDMPAFIYSIVLLTHSADITTWSLKETVHVSEKHLFRR